MSNNSDYDERGEPVIVELDVNSRTRHLISKISAATTKTNKTNVLQQLLLHFHEHPEARIAAVKERAVQILLNVRHRNMDVEISALVQEALCLLGYVDPPKGHGIRILSIDGGGTRGVVPIKLMMHLEKHAKKPIYELFDYVCGVSTGAILVSSVFAQKKSLEEVLAYYKELSKQVFSTNPITGIGRMVWTHGYYDSKNYETMLQSILGSRKMIHTSRDETCPKISMLSTTVNTGAGRHYVFRNYEFRHTVRSQYNGSSEHALWEAVRASSAAPLYFQEFNLGNYTHQDGGLVANNPSSIAIHEAHKLWPNVPLQCVVSLGTGECEPPLSMINKTTTSSWRTKFEVLMECATNVKNVDIALADNLPQGTYYRFNPRLTEKIGMSEILTEKLRLLEYDTDSYYYHNEVKFEAAAQTLLKPRTATQKLSDWVSLQANKWGLKSNM